MKWTEMKANDSYEEIFGEIKESTDKKIVSFSITVSVNEYITRLAEIWKCSRSEVIERVIEKEFSK